MGLERSLSGTVSAQQSKEAGNPIWAEIDNGAKMWPSGERSPGTCEADLTENRGSWEH